MKLLLAWTTLRQHPFMASCAAGLLSRLASLIGGVARLSKDARRYPVTILGMPLLARLSAGVLATLVFACRGVWRHLPSVVCTALLLSTSASLAGASVPLALLLWVVASLVSLATWRILEPFLLRHLGCRPPGHLERERLEPALAPACVEVQILDAPQPWLVCGVRSLVVSRALLDLLEDRALAGLLAHATIQVGAASLSGELVVWLGNLPLAGAWCLSRGLVRLGRLLALVVGASLVLPLALCPDGFTRWAGRALGAILVGLLGSALLSSGVSAAGLGLLLAWAIVPGLQTLVDWETRRAETAADAATVESGRGWELLEALEILTWVESVPPPPFPLGCLHRAAAPLTDRADRIWRKLAEA